jgi:hypothetical protein
MMVLQMQSFSLLVQKLNKEGHIDERF